MAINQSMNNFGGGVLFTIFALFIIFVLVDIIRSRLYETNTTAIR